MDIDRFVSIQKRNYHLALKEIKEGYKTSHWMWYIFPQLKGLGYSEMSDYYGIKDINEAKEFLNNEYLRDNLLEICEELLKLDTDNVLDVFGYPDNYKLCSSMTLFNYAEPNNEIFIEVLDKFYNGKKDDLTIKMLSRWTYLLF